MILAGILQDEGLDLLYFAIYWTNYITAFLVVRDVLIYSTSDLNSQSIAVELYKEIYIIIHLLQTLEGQKSMNALIIRNKHSFVVLCVRVSQITISHHE